MKNKKCPYCGKRVSYISVYASRRKGEYICERCGKESKVSIDKKVILFFAIILVVSLAVMIVWAISGLINNPLGILLVAVPFIIFAFFSPKFVNYEPLKKYKKSMEAKKEGIVYSDNLLTSELDDNSSFSFSTASSSSDNEASDFQINSDIFNKIKAERNIEKERINGNDIISNSTGLENNSDSAENYVNENYSFDEAPLKKIHFEGEQAVIRRNHHYINNENKDEDEDQFKYNSNRYSSHRKF